MSCSPGSIFLKWPRHDVGVGMSSAAQTTMPALTYVEPGRMAVVHEPIPDAGDAEALVRVRVSGICGSEIHGVRSQDRLCG